MDPVHLRPSEMEYELQIRGISGLSNARTRTKTIRELLKKEALGIESNPIDSSGAYPVEQELRECERILRTINQTIDTVSVNDSVLLWNEAEHRLLHLKGRLKRIHVKNSDDDNILQVLLVGCDDLVRRIGSMGRESIERRISFNIPNQVPLAEQGAAAINAPPVQTETGLPLRESISSLAGQKDFLGFGPRPTQPAIGSTTMGRGRGVRPPSGHSTIHSIVGSRNSRIPTPPTFAERSCIPTSQSLFDLDQVGATSSEYRTDRPIINWEEELRRLRNRESQVTRANIADANTIINSLSTLNLRDEVPSHNHATFVIPTVNSRRDIVNPSLLNPNIPISNAANCRRELSPAPVYRMNAQHITRSDPSRRYSDPIIYADADEEHLFPSANQRRQAAQQQREESRYRQDYRPQPYAVNDNNIAPDRFEARQPRNERQFALDNDQRFPYRPREDPYFDPDADFRAPYPRPAYKSVPVNHWKVYFSGDGQGLHLFDFLSQVRMLQRSERIPDRELLPMMVHLFTGRAKNWYGRWSDTIHTWNDLEDALKAEFLPENYSFIMLEKITSRKQKAGESIGEFLALMQSQFMWLGIPIDDLHKVFIVRNNLLPKYAQSIAAFEIRNLAELAQVCRRVESATQSVSMNLPFESPNYSRCTAPRTKNVNEVEQEEVQPECSGEVCTIGKFGQVKCYNCQKNGHVFRTCMKPREGVFCYGCGGKNVTTKTCVKCAGNGARGMTTRVSQEVSPEVPTAAHQEVLPRQSSA